MTSPLRLEGEGPLRPADAPELPATMLTDAGHGAVSLPAAAHGAAAMPRRTNASTLGAWAGLLAWAKPVSATLLGALFAFEAPSAQAQTGKTEIEKRVEYWEKNLPEYTGRGQPHKTREAEPKVDRRPVVVREIPVIREVPVEQADRRPVVVREIPVIREVPVEKVDKRPVVVREIPVIREVPVDTKVDKVTSVREREVVKEIPVRVVVKKADFDVSEVALELARDITRRAGSGTREDVEVAAKALARVPVPLLKIAKQSGVSINVCRGSVVDGRPELKGVQPRGWGPGRTWGDVNGCHSAGVVFIAMTSSGELPTGASHSVLGHEMGHALFYKAHDFAKFYDLDTFRKAYDADRSRLSNGYFLQEGEAGRDETFAESFGKYYWNDPNFKKDWPNIHQFWADADAKVQAAR